MQLVGRETTMQATQIDPLDFAIWQARVRQLYSWPIEGSGPLEKALRHSFHLVQLAPLEFRLFVSCELPEAEFEAHLEAGEHLSAAVALVCDAHPEALGPAQIRAEREAPAATVFREWLSRVINACERASAQELASSNVEMSKGHLHIVHSSIRASGGSDAQTQPLAMSSGNSPFSRRYR